MMHRASEPSPSSRRHSGSVPPEGPLSWPPPPVRNRRPSPSTSCRGCGIRFPNKRRFRVAIFFNEERVDIPCLDSAILELAHALVTGEYVVKDGVPRLNWICGVEI
jgi:hypothetical protein